MVSAVGLGVTASPTPGIPVMYKLQDSKITVSIIESNKRLLHLIRGLLIFLTFHVLLQ